MKLKEVIKQILPHYEKALIEMPKEGHYEWLYSRYIAYGICHFSRRLIGVDISKKMEKSIGYFGLLHHESPKILHTYQQNLKQIQNRVDWMREYLSKN